MYAMQQRMPHPILSYPLKTDFVQNVYRVGFVYIEESFDTSFNINNFMVTPIPPPHKVYVDKIAHRGKG